MELARLTAVRGVSGRLRLEGFSWRLKGLLLACYWGFGFRVSSKGFSESLEGFLATGASGVRGSGLLLGFRVYY